MSIPSSLKGRAFVALVALSIVGCGSTTSVSVAPDDHPATTDRPAVSDVAVVDREAPDVGAPTVDAGAEPDVPAVPVDASTTVSGLPCDVSALLATWCVSCHSAPPRHDAQQPLLTRADLAAPSMTDLTMSNAQLALARMQDPMSPMPPAGAPVPADQIAIFQRWVAAGMPAGTTTTCGSGMPDPLNAAPRCTSNLTWFFGNNLGDFMNPGEACIACHATRRAPSYQIAGTVYPSGHEPAQCIPPLNVAAGARVEITDAAGHVTNITTNATGNFHWAGALALPYTARVVASDGRQRRMNTPQRNGDCNACHTAAGLMEAPGRITMPAP